MSILGHRNYDQLNLTNVSTLGDIVIRGTPNFLEGMPPGADVNLLTTDSTTTTGLSYLPYQTSNNVYYIDTLYGNNATGIVGSPIKSFFSLTFVLGLVPPVGSVFILIGDFNEILETFPLNVSNYTVFCTFNCNFTNNSVNPIFSGNNFNILGTPNFILNNSLGGIYNNVSSDTTYIYCDKIVSTNSIIFSSTGINSDLIVVCLDNLEIYNNNNAINSIFTTGSGTIRLQTSTLVCEGYNCISIQDNSGKSSIYVEDNTFINNINVNSDIITISANYFTFKNNSVFFTKDVIISSITTVASTDCVIESNIFYIRNSNAGPSFNLDNSAFYSVVFDYDSADSNSNIPMSGNSKFYVDKLFLPMENLVRSSIFLNLSIASISDIFIASLDGLNSGFLIATPAEFSLEIGRIDTRVSSGSTCIIEGNSVALNNSGGGEFQNTISFKINNLTLNDIEFTNIIKCDIMANTITSNQSTEFIGDLTGNNSVVNIDANELLINPLNGFGFQITVSEFNSYINHSLFNTVSAGSPIFMEFLTNIAIPTRQVSIYSNFNDCILGSVSSYYYILDNFDITIKVNNGNYLNNVTLVTVGAANNCNLDLGWVYQPDVVVDKIAGVNPMLSIRCQGIDSNIANFSGVLFVLDSPNIMEYDSINITNIITTTNKILNLMGRIKQFFANKIISSYELSPIFSINAVVANLEHSYKFNDIEHNSLNSIFFQILSHNSLIMDINRAFCNSSLFINEIGNISPNTTNNRTLYDINYMGIRPVTGNIPINFLNAIVNPSYKKIRGFYGIDTAGTATNYFNITNLIAGPGNPPEIILDDVVISDTIPGNLTNSITVGNNQDVYIYGNSGSTNAVGAGVTTAIGTYTINASFL